MFDPEVAKFWGFRSTATNSPAVTAGGVMMKMRGGSICGNVGGVQGLQAGMKSLPMESFLQGESLGSGPGWT